MKHSSQSKTWDEWLTHKLFSGHWNTPHKLGGTPGNLGPTWQPCAKLLYNSDCCPEISRSEGQTNATKETHIYFKIQ